METRKKIEVTVVTGFLGAGKTTFINYLLKNNTETQFALVENEFGDVAIDTKLIKGLDTSQMFELKKGCICCTISGEFELVLQELAERFPNVEHLLIETTGIADPAPVIRPFFGDENLQKDYHFNGTICLVDAIHFQTQPEKEIALKQIAIADLVLINKSERLDTKRKEKIQNEILQINPLGEINFAEFGYSSGFQLNSLINKNKFLPDPQRIDPVHSKISSQTIIFQKPLNREHFTEWLSYTLDLYKNEIYRTKGIICFKNEPYEYILQGVGGSFEILEGDYFTSGNKSEMVFIGKLAGVELKYHF
jgi:G3E family GTPase